MTVLGFTYAMQASLMISQAKTLSNGGRFPILHFTDVVVDEELVVFVLLLLVVVVVVIAGVVVVVVDLVIDAVVEGVVDGVVDVVVERVVVGVVEGAAGVVLICGFLTSSLFFKCRFLSLALVQAAVTVTTACEVGRVLVVVEVTSWIGTKLEQKAEALRAISTALQTSMSLRASSCSTAVA